MNRIRPVSGSQHSVRTRRLSQATWEAVSRPVIRNRMVFFAALAFAACNGNAMTSPSDPLKSELRQGQTELSNPGMRVWIEKGAHKLNLDASGVILKGYDPVAYFTEKKAVQGSPKYQSKYKGAIYYFSSAANLATFKKSPSKYVPQYGGFCANGMANRKASDIDPTVFFVLKGKLYVCASPEAERQFRSKEAANIKKADQNWDEEDRWFY